MNADLQQLVDETIAVTGAAPPQLLSEDAPVLSAEALAADAEAAPYFVGLIGGKEVGKSSFVNAIVGTQITPPSAHGAGTEMVIAYAHHSATDEVRQLLEREVPGRHRIHPHNIDRLRRQVLLDLPDIDSHYADHIGITRRMLRHMLYPIWIQSIEKYADQQPQKLLLRVAEGNDPSNFIFCLNKVDQLIAHEGAAAAEQIREDYAQRLMRALRLPAPPRVRLLSALQPQGHDFPELGAMLSEQRSQRTVQHSRELAGRQQSRSLLSWLDRQGLAQQAQSAARLVEEAHELAAARIAAPLLEEALPRLADDPGVRLALVDPVVRARISRWPIVNMLDTLLAPLWSLLQKNLGAAGVTALPTGAAPPIDLYLQQGERPLATMVQTTFAQLRQSHPQIAPLYGERKLWDTRASDMAAMDLRTRISATFARQRAAVLQKLAGRGGIITAPLRWLLTIGALLWFPIIQPVSEAVLAGTIEREWAAMALFIVRTLSASFLLRSIAFLLIYFLVLWMVLRWDTQRRVNRQVQRWKSAGGADPLTSPAAQVIGWIDELLEPLREHHRRLQALANRAEAIRQSLQAQRDAA